MLRLIAKKSLPKAGLAEKWQALTLKQKVLEVPISRRSDEELMQSYQLGEAMAFDVLMARHQKPLYHFIYRFLHNEQASQDAFQEVFLRVIRNRSEYRESAKFTTWLYTIARNHCIDELRKLRFRNHKSLDAENENRQERYFSQSEGLAKDPQDFSIAKEVEAHLEKALTELPLEQREVFLLRHFQNMAFDEIASVSHVSVNTVKSRMRYALQHIEKHFRRVGVL